MRKRCKHMHSRSPSKQESAVVVRIGKRRRKPIDPREQRFNAEFGQRLKLARTLRKLSQRQFADALRIGHDQYKKYEYGSRSFPLYLFEQLPNLLDKSLSWLLTGRG